MSEEIYDEFENMGGFDIDDIQDARRGRGRPRKDEPCNIQLKGWISTNEQELLSHMLMESERSKSDLLRRMIRTYYYTYHGKW